MSQIYLVPQWFFGYGIFLELFFALITLSVAAYSWYIYRLCAQKECRLFAVGFGFISMAYFFWAGINFYVTSTFDPSTLVLSLSNLNALGSLGVYAHVFLFILGLVTLAYMTFDGSSLRNYTLLATLSLVAIIFSEQKAIAFYFVSSLLLSFVVFYYGAKYYHSRRGTNLLVFLAFFFLFLGNVDFIFAAIDHVHYVVGHILQLLGYAFILLNFLLTLRKR